MPGTAFIEAVKRANLQFQLTDAITAAQQKAKLNEFQNILRYDGDNPAVFDWTAVTTLGTAQVGNGATTNFLDSGYVPGPPSGVVLRLVTTVGSTPTCTYQVQGSPDHSTWSNALSADSGSPTTFSAATFVVTTAGTKILYVPAQGFRYYQVVFSANTNVTNTTDAFVL